MTDTRRAALEEERDFLLTSLRDLDRERDAGDVDDHDYQTLKDDYTARAAAVLRALEAGRAPRRRRLPANRMRTAGWIGIVAVIAALSGVLVAQASGQRGDGDPLTGLDVRAETTRVNACLDLDRTGELAMAEACFTEVLADNETSADSYTGRGWLRIRRGDDLIDDGDLAAGLERIDAGIDDLTQAIDLAPRATAPLLFRSIGRTKQGNPIAALGDLVAFDANGPTQIERDLAADFIPSVLDAATSACIELDIAGTGGTVPLSCYTDVLRLDEAHAPANAYLGFLLAKAGFADRGIEHLDRALATDPSLSQAYVFRAAAHASVGDAAAASRDLDTFDALPDTPSDQVAAAAAVRVAVSEGRDPFA